MVKKGRTHTIQQLKYEDMCKFVWRFGAIRHERANKIHVPGDPLGPARNY